MRKPVLKSVGVLRTTWTLFVDTSGAGRALLLCLRARSYSRSVLNFQVKSQIFSALVYFRTHLTDFTDFWTLH